MYKQHVGSAIMNCGCLTDNKKVNAMFARTIWNSCAIYVLRTHSGIKRFVSSSSLLCSNSDKFAVGKVVSMFQDTGNGYKNFSYPNSQHLIENIILLHKDGTLSSENDIGLDEKRTLWCFK